MPPTSNNMYVPINGRLIKSNESRKYDVQIERIKIKLFRELDEFKKLINQNSFLRVDVICVFPFKKVFTKKNELRKFDHSNRVKPIFDSISKLVGLDDSHFIDGRIIKSFHEFDYEIVYVYLHVLDKLTPIYELKYPLS